MASAATLLPLGWQRCRCRTGCRDIPTDGSVEPRRSAIFGRFRFHGQRSSSGTVVSAAVSSGTVSSAGTRRGFGFRGCGFGRRRGFLRSGVHSRLPDTFVREKRRRYQRNGNDHGQAGYLYISDHWHPPIRGQKVLSTPYTVPARPRKRPEHLQRFRHRRWGFSPPAPGRGSSPCPAPEIQQCPRRQGGVGRQQIPGRAADAGNGRDHPAAADDADVQPLPQPGKRAVFRAVHPAPAAGIQITVHLRQSAAGVNQAVPAPAGRVTSASGVPVGTLTVSVRNWPW